MHEGLTSHREHCDTSISIKILTVKMQVNFANFRKLYNVILNIIIFSVQPLSSMY